MMIPFTPLPGTTGPLPGTTGPLPGTWGTNNNIIYTGSGPVSPFAHRKPKDPQGILAVKLRGTNLPAVAYHVALNSSGMGVYIAPDRESIQIGEKRFDIGEWIVQVHLSSGNTYRHATEDEAKEYGLD